MEAAGPISPEIPVKTGIKNDLALEHFPAKWMPVRVAKMRQNNEIEPRSDSIGAEKALGPGSMAGAPKVST
jgi:hypothetical protein